MQARLAEELRLADLAALVGLSPFHFTRAFRTAAGRPPHQMLMHLRVEKARDLLGATRQSVLEIALEVGYGSGQALGRAFKRLYGMSPERYREAIGARAPGPHPINRSVHLHGLGPDKGDKVTHERREIQV